MLVDLQVAWAKAYRLLEADNAEKHIRGIMTNIISLLLKANWKPTTVNCWIDPEGYKRVMSGASVAPDVVAAAINKPFFNIELVRAADHYLGKGLEFGLHYNATMAWLRNLKSHHYNSKCLLETILSGATWPADRIHNAYPEHSPLCPRCGLEPEDALHCFWTCQENANIDEHVVKKTQHLIQTAKTSSNEHPCLWLRGLLPANLINIPPDAEPLSSLDITYINPENVSFDSGTYYGDASGGEYTVYADIRRVGCAFARTTSSGELIYAAHYPLPGEVQTVARGELLALVVLLRFAAPLAEIDFVTDNKGVFDKYNAGPKLAKLSSNCDLYHELFQLVFRKGLLVTVRWMPSHLKPEDPRPLGVSEVDVIGNDWADKYAKVAAETVQVSAQVAKDCIYYYKLVKRIQKRMVCIIMNLPERSKHKVVRTPKELAVNLDSCITASRHAITQSGDRISCRRCLNNSARKDKSVVPWLATECIEIPSSSRPTPIDNNLLHVGNQNIHHSHALAVHRGLVYCSKCGCRRGEAYVKKLARACEPPSDYGAATLKAVSLDKLPPRLKAWPCPPA